MKFSRQTFKRRAAVIGTAIALALPLSAHAQSAEFSAAQLQSFAVAVAAIDQIATKWQPQVQAATDENQAKAMIEQADSEMRQAIENSGSLSLEEFQNIMQAAQTDPGLKSRIDELVKEAPAQ